MFLLEWFFYRKTDFKELTRGPWHSHKQGNQIFPDDAGRCMRSGINQKDKVMPICTFLLYVKREKGIQLCTLLLHVKMENACHFLYSCCVCKVWTMMDAKLFIWIQLNWRWIMLNPSRTSLFQFNVNPSSMTVQSLFRVGSISVQFQFNADLFPVQCWFNPSSIQVLFKINPSSLMERSI